MPELFQGVVTRRAVHGIADDEQCGLRKQNAAAMEEAGVGAGGVQQVLIDGGGPAVDGDFRLLVPAEGSGGNGLIAAIDAKCVMSGNAAKAVSLVRVGDVGIGARVDQDVAAGEAGGQAEDVGVAVASGAFSKGTGLNDDANAGRGHHGGAGVREQSGCGFGRWDFRGGEHLRSEPPGRLRSEIRRIVEPLGAAKEHAAGGHGSAAELHAVAVRMEETAAIVIADQGQDTRGREQRIEIFRHTDQAVLVGRGGLGREAVEQEEIQRVHVIVGRLFEVGAVFADLAKHFLLHDACAGLRPSRRVRKGGEEDAEGVQRDGLAEQMSIGGEVDGEVEFQETRVAVEFGQEAAAKGGGHFGAGHLPEPRPGEGAECHFQGAGPIDAAQEGIGVEPTGELGEGFLQVGSIAGEKPGLGEQRQVLMAIEFPNYFVVADLGEIEVRGAAEVRSAGGDSVQVVAAPVDRGAGIDGEAEKGKTVGDDLVRDAREFGGVRGAAEGGGDRVAARGARASGRERWWRGGLEATETSPGSRAPGAGGIGSRRDYARLAAKRAPMTGMREKKSTRWLGAIQAKTAISR